VQVDNVPECRTLESRPRTRRDDESPLTSFVPFSNGARPSRSPLSTSGSPRIAGGCRPTSSRWTYVASAPICPRNRSDREPQAAVHGLTSTVAALLPAQARDVKIAASRGAARELAATGVGRLPSHAWQPRRTPCPHLARRRNSEMLAGS